MTRVFVSHASDGLEPAAEVCRWLVEAGHDVFLDKDRREGIPVGEAWRQRLHERLRWADVVVCVVTSLYLTSRWCAAEVEIARSRGSWLLPLHAEPGVMTPRWSPSNTSTSTRTPRGPGCTARGAPPYGCRRWMGLA